MDFKNNSISDETESSLNILEIEMVKNFDEEKIALEASKKESTQGIFMNLEQITNSKSQSRSNSQSNSPPGRRFVVSNQKNMVHIQLPSKES